jgi:hypothetical protein
MNVFSFFNNILIGLFNEEPIILYNKKEEIEIIQSKSTVPNLENEDEEEKEEIIEGESEESTLDNEEIIEEEKEESTLDNEEIIEEEKEESTLDNEEIIEEEKEESTLDNEEIIEENSNTTTENTELYLSFDDIKLKQEYFFKKYGHEELLELKSLEDLQE